MFTAFEATEGVSAEAPWRVTRVREVVASERGSGEGAGGGFACGGGLRVRALDSLPSPPSAPWRLIGVASHARYTHRNERATLDAVSAGLGRAEATRGALIPIGKSAAWWAMSQDERRAVFEERSGHIRRTLRYLPGVARKLYHSRDLDGPFDFLTWFEFAPEHEAAFDELLVMLRASEEWRYLDREFEVRLERAISR